MLTLAILSNLGIGSIVGLADSAQAQQEDGNQNSVTVQNSVTEQVGNNTYFLYYQMSNQGSIDNITVDAYLTMKMNITSPSNGTLELIFSRELYDALSFTEHDEPLLYVSGRFSDELPVISKSCEQTSITIPVQAGTRELDIVYSDVLMNHTHSYPENIQLVKEIER